MAKLCAKGKAAARRKFKKFILVPMPICMLQVYVQVE